MVQQAVPAAFMRGGTSKALMLHARDLPPNRDDWAPLFTGAMGSPDPNGRQLDGMGGGVSSLSKVCIISPSEREDADVDYTFCQVLVKDASVQYKIDTSSIDSASRFFSLAFPPKREAFAADLLKPAQPLGVGHLHPAMPRPPLAKTSHC